jgi:hypothetical protein
MELQTSKGENLSIDDMGLERRVVEPWGGHVDRR